MIPQQAMMKDALNEARCSNELLEHLEHLHETNDLFGNVAKSQGQCPGILNGPQCRDTETRRGCGQTDTVSVETVPGYPLLSVTVLLVRVIRSSRLAEASREKMTKLVRARSKGDSKGAPGLALRSGIPNPIPTGYTRPPCVIRSEEFGNLAAIGMSLGDQLRELDEVSVRRVERTISGSMRSVSRLRAATFRRSIKEKQRTGIDKVVAISTCKKIACQ